jgi:hypothetical protein
MGDYINRLRGNSPPKKEVNKQAELSAIKRMGMSFRELVYAVLGNNLSSQDTDLLARASTMPWLFPDVAQFQSGKHINIQQLTMRSAVHRRCFAGTTMNV